MKRNIESLGIGMVFVALLVFFSATIPGFASRDNVDSILQSVAPIGLVACTMLLCLAAGDFDLSVGSTGALAGVLAAWMIKDGKPAGVALLAAIGLALAIGLFNGFDIARIGINALITTLATMQIVRGSAQLLAQGTPISCSDPAFVALNHKVMGVNMPVWLMLAAFGIFAIVLNLTAFGRNVLAVGGNAEAARLAGIGVPRIKIVVFALQGALCGLAGLTQASRVSLAEPNAFMGFELSVISACVLGGVSLTGGVGTVSGAVIGVLIMGTVQNAMSLKGVDQFWQLIVTGMILLGAVLFDRVKTIWGQRSK
jgi:L-arabinose transport system permease protein